jgi:hypothetical protein
MQGISSCFNSLGIIASPVHDDYNDYHDHKFDA